MNFQSFGQTVKGHSRDLGGKSKGKTEQSRKVRAKPVGRNQLGVKMQLSLKIMPSSTPHQKFCFYHLPTRGRAGIKLGDANTSPTSL